MTETVIEATNVEKHFPLNKRGFSIIRDEQRYVKAVDGVDITINRGDIVGLVGESGCGKTTLGKVLLGLDSPTGGSIKIKGEDLTDKSKQDLRSMRNDAQMIFQNPFQTLSPRFSVRSNMLEPLKIHGIGSKDTMMDRIERGLEDVGLNPDEVLDRFPSELSGGQRQRVSIARAFLLDPDFIVADEPVSMLDVSIKKDILDLLRINLENNDACMLYISHDLSTIGHICEYIHVMYLGTIVERGPTKDIIKRPAHPYTRLLVQAIPTVSLEKERKRVSDLGEVPSSESLPSGCRFHPRCPKVIPPEDWPADQEMWKDAIELVSDLNTGTAMNVVAQQHSNPSSEDQISALFEEYFGTTDIPPSIAEPIKKSIREGFPEKGNDNVTVDIFSSICTDVTPSDFEIGDDHYSACHLHRNSE
jgi:peptide/nickel transport system ATP-binding protein